MKKNLRQLKYRCFLSLAIALFISESLYAQTVSKKSGNTKTVSFAESEIVFTESSWTAVLKKAMATHKYIFVDANASWCAPCKLLKTTTFRDKEAAAFFNKNFINFSMDMEKGEGPGLALQWEVEAYPTLLIVDATGKTVLGNVGFLKAEDLIKFGKQALEKKMD